MAMPSLDSAPAAADAVRRELTRERLLAAVAHLPNVIVVGFADDWWDGQAHVPCLVVRGGRRQRLLRVVETAGEAVVVPFSRRTAERWLAARRRPRRVELGLVPPQRRGDVVVVAEPDAQRCRTRGCSVLRPVGQAGGCPVCGAA